MRMEDEGKDGVGAGEAAGPDDAPGQQDDQTH